MADFPEDTWYRHSYKQKGDPFICLECGYYQIRLVPLFLERYLTADGLPVRRNDTQCQKCNSPMPWLDTRTYGVNYRERYKEEHENDEIDELFGGRKPLWTI